MALNDISTQHTVGVFWVSGHSGGRGNEITDKFTRDDTVVVFVSVKLWLHADTHILVPFSWTWRMLRV